MRFPRIVVALAMAASALFCSVARAQDADAIAQARAAASSWLVLVDTARYSASWEQSADLFKASIGQAAWGSAVQAARAPLGPLRSRELKSSMYTRTLPGEPDGEYVVITYVSQFQNRANAIEIVTPLRGKDGVWRVSGYFVK
jgi:Protein of unknown function (DUF4019)